ncbi:MAG: hypothetical protein KJ592_01650 [Nanoarchaeota archaeon]|nr:hypothetical protein [Nanoarchaeota archaeon]
MEIKSIKGIDSQTWNTFKATAIKNNIRMSMLLKLMLSEFNKNSKTFWDNILNDDENLTEKEANDIEKITSNIRKEKGFRI